jgi:predicted DsbA family dithiol-disulfide isomerase
MMAQLIQTARDLDLPFGKREKTFNSRLAQELGKFAEQEGRGDDFHHSVFRAYFADGLNIGLASTLADISANVGLDAGSVQEVLEKRPFKEAVDKDWTRSYQMGVTAVPTFMLDGMALAGAQPYGKLVQMMDQHGIKRRI